MFDFGKFTNWLSGGLFNSHSTWETYKSEEHSWTATAAQLSAPLIVLWGLAAVVLGWIFGTGNGFADFIGPLISGVIWFALAGFVASFFAKNFGGTNSFDQAFAALTFASIPAAIGGVVGTLPFIGWLIALAGFIWTIMLLWQSLPVFLDIPLERRTGHFFATLAVSLIGMIFTGFLFAAIGLSGAMLSMSSDDSSSSRIDYDPADAYKQRNSTSVNSSSSSNKGSNSSRSATAPRPASSNSSSGSTTTTTVAKDSGAGFFGFGREVDYLESANLDTYAPPVDGMLQEAQVERTAKFFAAAGRIREASTESFKKLEDKDNSPSLGDFVKGMKGLVGAGTAEMQAVKSGGGNWAEHEWVKKQLFEARIHQDLNNTTAHNYELYQAYEEQIKDWL